MAFASNVENFSPDVIRRVTKELKELTEDPPEGIKLMINDRDITDLQFMVEGPVGTPYAGGIFRIKLSLPKDFPLTPPRGYFLTRIFHPNVAPNSGEICVNTLKKDWKSEYGIKHILLTIKCLLIVPNAESALNEEAGKLLLEQYDEYAKRAKMITEIHARAGKDHDQHAAKPSTNKVDGNDRTLNNKRPAADNVDSGAVPDMACANATNLAEKKSKDRAKKMLKRL